ncbi:rhodanese-like domain-containing protein [Methylobacter psychrophilus]|uniref:rhodanese-like domain-containing protein n=1 Tax=Methylobacter psychrophilus TaxID=96941 RepID=UPI0021D4B2CB|nr:rhodanese-like domain-containing protein [Methylobacter psychrophilus]
MSSKIKVKTTLLHLAAVIFIVTGCSSQEPDYVKIIPATELMQILQNEDVFLVDVHTPEQQHIKGTDLFVPYNEIEKFQDKFPRDKNTAIYLYCQGGPMGDAAAKSLYKLGYHNVINLEGGTNAWKTAGFGVE